MGATPARLALILFSLAVVALCILSAQRVTGDGAEYIAIADALAHFHAPSGHAWHFWFFPALSVPLLWVFASKPVLAFTCVNLALLAAAFAVVRRRVGLWAAAFVCAGPILWWIDKAQVEVFTVSLLAMGCALSATRGRAALAFAAASTQNPPIAIGALLLALERLLRDRRAFRSEWRWWTAALALSVINPLFYLSTLGRLTPLVPSNDARLPAPHTMLAVVFDSNIGLLPNAPVAALILVVVIVAAGIRGGSRRRGLFAAVVGLTFLAAFAQAPNVNSGGTPDMSRYALWLIPLALIVWPPRSSVTLRAGISASVLWSLLFFRPSLPEHYLAPTRLAAWLWTKHPSWENPLPEVFAERLRHQDGVNTLAATPNCSKVLIQEGAWPEGCVSTRVPAACSAPNALCYANRTSDGRYSFVPTTRRGGVQLR